MVADATHPTKAVASAISGTARRIPYNGPTTRRRGMEFLGKFVDELPNRFVGIGIGLGFGWLFGWLVARYQRRKDRLTILAGNARDSVVVDLHLVEKEMRPDGTAPPKSLRIRSLAQAQLRQVVPNRHLSAILLKRAGSATAARPLIGMDGAQGSFLLESLMNFVGDRLGNAPFDHHLYVMAPCCEPAELTGYQPITVLLIRVDDLELFESWEACRETCVERGADGARVLTLMELARHFKAEQAEHRRRKAAGTSPRFLETVYLLDLALDHRAAAQPLKPIPWTRYSAALAEMGLE